MAHKKSAPQKPLVRTHPLKPEQLETFVRIYRDCFDGAKAARIAKYEKPHEIWQDLLAREDVQARLCGYRAGVDVPARSGSSVFEHLFEAVFGRTDNVLMPDIVTGEMRLNRDHDAAQGAGFLEYEEVTHNHGGIPTRTTRIRNRGSMDILKVLVQNFQSLGGGPDDQPDSLSEAISALSRTASMAPMRKPKYKDKPE